jgi:hypothetical protein
MSMTDRDEKLIDAWLDALRSGDYKQGIAALRWGRHTEAQEYCCLGVLCDVLDPGGWDLPDTAGRSPFAGRVTDLPEEVRVRVGLSHVQMTVLIEMNDGGRGSRDFFGIANAIEKMVGRVERT